MIDLRYRAAPNGRIGDQLNSELLEISPDDRMPAIVDDDPVSDHERKTICGAARRRFAEMRASSRARTPAYRARRSRTGNLRQR